jgi:tetratricopeptide (TPR) repeat protein
MSGINRIFLWAVVCILVFSVLPTHEMCSAYIGPHVTEFHLQPKVDGSVHIKIDNTMGYSWSSYAFSFFKSTPLKNTKAWDAETGAPLEIIATEEESEMEYRIDFGTWKERGFQFFFEFDILNKVKEDDEVYELYFGRIPHQKILYKATVILPEKHELLSIELLTPRRTSTRRNQVYIMFEEEVDAEETFEFKVYFSKKGLELIDKGENMYNQGEYNEALSAYKGAIDVYSRFTTLHGRDTNEFLKELQNRMVECWEKVADEKVGKAMAAFDRKEYALALELFKEVHFGYALYALFIEDFTKADECQEWINKCSALVEKQEKAESFLSEGITHFEQEEYEVARDKIKEALVLYTELQDEEKIRECNQKIAESFLNEGIIYREQKEYEKAKSKIEEALSLYTTLQDEEKITECEQHIRYCNKYLGISGFLRRYGIIIGGIVLLIVGMGIVYRKRTKDQ